MKFIKIVFALLVLLQGAEGSAASAAGAQDRELRQISRLKTDIQGLLKKGDAPKNWAAINTGDLPAGTEVIKFASNGLPDVVTISDNAITMLVPIMLQGSSAGLQYKTPSHEVSVNLWEPDVQSQSAFVIQKSENGEYKLQLKGTYDPAKGTLVPPSKELLEKAASMKEADAKKHLEDSVNALKRRVLRTLSSVTPEVRRAFADANPDMHALVAEAESK